MKKLLMQKFTLGLTKIRKVKIKLAKLSWSLPGGPLFAKKQTKTFEEATDEAIDALKKQITSINKR